MKFGFHRSRIVTSLGRIPGIGRISTRLYARWLLLKFDFFWKVLRNPPSRRRFARKRPTLDSTQQCVSDNLKESGVALTSFDALIGDEPLWGRLSQRVEAFSSSPRVRDGLAIYQQEIERIGSGDISPKQARILKRYMMTLYTDDETPTISLDDELFGLGLDPKILDVVNSYFGLWAKLIYFDLWHTTPVGTLNTRFGSQRWHRDPEDRVKCRVYLYFSDVDEGTGPLQYVPGSQRGGPRWGTFPWTRPDGYNYPPQEEAERLLPASDRLTCAGSRGTMVFCDTIGLHRGGPSRTAPRILATWGFVTPASLHGHRFAVDARTGGSNPLSDAARFALSL